MKVVKTKKRCCKDRPRCKRCPVVLKRMTKAGAAQRVGPRSYVVLDVLSKAERKALRT